MARAGYHTKLPKEVFIMIVLLLLLQWWSSHDSLEEERAALLQLQHSFNYANVTSRLLSGMNIDCSNWRVECDVTTGRVNKLHLNGFRDESLGEWKFNASVFLPFRQLRSLDLSNNNIVCCVKKEGFEGLQMLNNLESLYLDGNYLGNNILSMFYGFQSLQILSLRSIGLSGSIHVKDLVNIPNLNELYLNGNNIEKFVSSKGIKTQSNISTLQLGCDACKEGSFEPQSLEAFQNLASLRMESITLKGELFPRGLNKVEELFIYNSDMDENFLLSLGTLRSLRFFTLINTLGVQSFPRLENLKLLDLSYSAAGNGFHNSIANITSLETLRLRNCKLTGSIHELCRLRNLKNLDLRDNNVSGSLPLCLTNLTLLQYLDLSFNHFSENISMSSLKSLTSIEFLYIFDNQFQIPISLSPFFNHSKLKYLFADENKVYAESGGVDNNLTPKFQLEELSLSSTYEEGGVSFPKFLHHQHDLRFLNLSDIQMRGVRFPSWLLDNNTNLESLYLKNCSLLGTLRFSIHPHGLNLLDISNNLFYGQIPKDIPRYFPKLQLLILPMNDFTGKIPNSLSNCYLLRVLITSDNKLFGNIPEWIGSMSPLSILDLSNNNFSGSLPSIFLPPQASHIHLSRNRLEGPFPNVFTNSSVVTLDLSHNYLTGGIPNSIKNLKRLRYVLLNHNNLEGEIPTCLWMMMNELRFVDLSHNRLGTFSVKHPHKNSISKTSQGYEIPEIDGTIEFGVKENTYRFRIYRMIMINFIGLDLSSNNLKCPIPFQIGIKEGMKTLNLSRNNLIGHIPFSFSNMTEVESLDLSYNNLNGTLPPQLVQLKSLEVFSVAYNNISGKTPERVAQFATFEESSYRGNHFLCGLPLPKNCTPTISSSTKESSTDDTDDDGFIDKEVFQVSFWVTFTIILLGIVSVLYINPYWRQAWFCFIELTITTCYYFLVDHLTLLPKFGNTLLF